jgi:hypothetical protein
VIEFLQRWRFKQGFRCGHADAKLKTKIETVPGSWFSTGYRLGWAAYACHLDPDAALASALRGVFEKEDAQ